MTLRGEIWVKLVQRDLLDCYVARAGPRVAAGPCA
jgi:hypothetical protein